MTTREKRTPTMPTVAIGLLAVLNIVALGSWLSGNHSARPRERARLAQVLEHLQLEPTARREGRVGTLLVLVDPLDVWAQEHAQELCETVEGIDCIRISPSPLENGVHLERVRHLVMPLARAASILDLSAPTGAFAASRWVLFDRQGEFKADGELEPGTGLVGDLRQLESGAFDAGKTFRDGLDRLDAQEAPLSGRLGIGEVSGVSAYLFVGVFGKSCPASAALTLVDRLARRETTTTRFVAVVPRDWPLSAVGALRDNWELSVPVVRADEATDLLWSRLKIDGGRSYNGGFLVAEYSDGKMDVEFRNLVTAIQGVR